MSSGPYGPQPADTPPPVELQPQREGSAHAEDDSAPPPPTGPAPLVARSKGPPIPIIVVVAIIVVAVVAYGVAGFAFAQSRLNSSLAAYNAVVDHQNSLTNTVNSLDKKLTGANVTASTTSDLQANKETFAQVVSQSQAAQAQIEADDESLAKADAGLKENQWLTLISKPNMDKASTRIGHLRKALADARTITTDYVLIGTFYQSLADVVIDLDGVAATAQASDLAGATAANQKLKTDTDTAISQDKAPGVPPEVDAFLQDIRKLANDFGTFFTAVEAKNSAAIDSSEKAIQADVTIIEAVDYTKIASEIDAFYKPLIDDYNSEVDKANTT